MWFLLLLCTAHFEQVFSQGDVNRLILKDGSNPCEGHIEIYHENKWGFVGDNIWDEKIEKVVCANAHCGEHQSTEDFQRDRNGIAWLNEISCTGNEANLWDCTIPGWNIIDYRKDSLKKIKCKSQIKIELEGFKCAGNVKYSIDGNSNYFCADNWGENEARLLCQSLGCGTVKEILPYEWIVSEGYKNSKNMMAKCVGIENLDNLWQCATPTDSCSRYASVICTGHTRVQLNGNTTNACHGRLEIEENGEWSPVNSSDKISTDELCKQMYCGTNANLDDKRMELHCTDNVEVVLMDKGEISRCYGEVHIKVNNSTYPVCASTWTSEDAEVVCRELKCGKVVSKDQRSNNKKAIMDNVKCSGKESSLWHCMAKHRDKPFECSSSAFVVCADSMNVRLSDGPGRCSGRVEIQYEGKWQRAIKKEWTSANSNTVCSLLNCGSKSKSSRTEKFSQGSGDFLRMTVACPSSATKISDCITRQSDNLLKEGTAVPLTCEDHKVVFLKGNNSCSGKVGIEHNQITYWLSGSNETWNKDSADTVCQQMHCGEASDYTDIQMNENEILWHQSYNCSSTKTSLFECENMSYNHSDTIAMVTCTGSITVNLTKGCWGNVNVCVGGKCGGVCKDSWSDEKSEMLCENLGCGSKIFASPTPEETEVIIRSMHTTKHTTNLNQCNLVGYGDGKTSCKPGYVVCSGSVKTRMNSSRYKCSGNVEMLYEGQWMPVCMDALKDIKTQNTICGEWKCGQAIKRLDYFGQTATRTRAISQIQCSANGNKPLAACNITHDQRPCPLGGLQCSEWRKMELKFGKACSGAVYVHSNGNKHAVSSEGWTNTEGNLLCKDLNCGSKQISYRNYTTNTSDSSKQFSCADVKNPENIWDCENSSLSHHHSQKLPLHIECQDEPNVTISQNCRGEVKINNVNICQSGWSLDYSNLVCQEKKCGKAILFDGKPAVQNDEYHSISCEDYHHSLGQCSRITMKCDQLVSVYCTGNVQFRTTERCGGEILVNYRNKWEKVHIIEVTFEITVQLCQMLGCGGPMPLRNRKRQEVTLETALNCTKDHKNIKYCVIHTVSEAVNPAEIYCVGYEQPPKPPVKSSIPILPIIIGVLFSLILVILIVVFVRVCVVKKMKKPRNVSSRTLSRKEVEFESGDYEDVATVPNAREDFNHGRFRSEAEVMTEGEARSTSSFPYDDIAEAVEARPLTSPTATAGAGDDKYFHQSICNSSSDGVTYEVDDSQENYDDIEACPEIAQTKAEVHDSSQTAPESIAATPPGLVKGEEDYLVPGQDG